MFERNLRKLREVAQQRGLSNLILLGKANITYATGLREPAGALVVSESCGDVMLVPLLDYFRAIAKVPKEVEVKAFTRGGEEVLRGGVPERDLVPGTLVEAIAKVVERCPGKVGLDASWGAGSTVRALEQRLGAEDVSEYIYKRRSIKEDWEVELIEGSLRVAEEAMRKLVEALREGVSELELAGAANMFMRKLGAWDEAFPTIVAFYQNTALPHHAPEELRLTLPGPVLIDLGSVKNGYFSDLTRTLWWGGNDREFAQRIEIVIEAQQAAIDRISPGAEAWEPDKEARLVLEKRGLAQYFNHGLGHGVGVEIHEEPYLRPGSRTVLEKGMVVTVEPGFYLPGLHGVRVEDLVLITSRGRRVLTSMARLLV
ncbi:MAG: Xaa-Pro peptidase family protein [Acidilobaceae archaeon]|nr:Xaa-Pro peptidase family protein [Acidilobaceae archaeon]MCX8165847.1 Xaa-Pro peptidase family protein [Acidilobaceae archaeon]MDW7974855.1 Xaa-Pro peptidase family protein [Sulfolobales archaeon]